jgi:hypothetical protein
MREVEAFDLHIGSIWQEKSAGLAEPRDRQPYHAKQL